MTQYKKVPGTLLSAAPVPVHQLLRTVYKADVLYMYTVNKKKYLGTRAFPLRKQTGSAAWAGALAEGLYATAAHGKLTVHYNPQRPNLAYIIPRHSFAPYAELSEAWVFGAIAWFIAKRYGPRMVDDPSPTPDGLYRLSISPSLNGPLWAAALGMAAWLITVALPCAAYAHVQAWPRVNQRSVAPFLATLFMLALALDAWHAWRRRRFLHGASVVVDTARPGIAQPFNATLTLAPRNPMELTDVQLLQLSVARGSPRQLQQLFKAQQVAVSPANPLACTVSVTVPPPAQSAGRKRRRARHGLVLFFKHRGNKYWAFFRFPVRATAPADAYEPVGPRRSPPLRV